LDVVRVSNRSSKLTKTRLRSLSFRKLRREEEEREVSTKEIVVDAEKRSDFGLTQPASSTGRSIEGKGGFVESRTKRGHELFREKEGREH